MAKTLKKPTTPRKSAAQPAPKAAGASSNGGKTPPRNKDGSFRKADNSHWGTAAIVGGVAAVSAVATAALLALRGSSALATIEEWVPGEDHPATAHQADGSDATASYDALIADEGTIPV